MNAGLDNFGQGPQFIAAADLDGDGNTDLLATSVGGIYLLMGKGDGTFGSPSKVVPYGVTNVAVADFNSDGKPDIVYALVGPAFLPAIASQPRQIPPIPFVISIVVVPGKGDGTFGAPVQYALAGIGQNATGAGAFIVSDFNNDGRPDILILISPSLIVLGNGDATGQKPVSLATGGFSGLAADFNGDGNIDLALATSAPGTAIFLGKGDGTFQTPAGYSLGAVAAAGDFNGDGITDLVVADRSGNSVGILQGKGDGTFQPGPAFSAAAAVAVADFNGDGKPDLLASTSVAMNVLLGATSSPAGTDLAQGKSATQSSTLPGTPASLAVDGNSDGNYYDGSVSVTNPDPNAWWQVDLGASMTIGSVAIWNRTDCCGSRLSDYWVFISDTPFLPAETPTTLQNRPGTFASHQTSAPNPLSTVAVNGVSGRYVRVQLSGADYLSLAEVQVFGSSSGAVASQSSQYPGSPSASVAIDGKTDGGYFRGSVTATNIETSPWWQEDLGVSTPINSIVVWNRTDCCGSRLGDYWVFVSNTPFQATDTLAGLQNKPGVFASHQTTAPNPSTTIPVGGFAGRYVRVQLSTTDYLSLAEVQVVRGSTSLVATESSQYPGSPQANAAIDGNTDGGYFNGSVTATNPDPNAWWQLDLGAPQQVNSVTIWNRTDCCGTRLSDYWVFVSNTPFLATDTPATLALRAGTASVHQTSAPDPTVTIPFGVQGRYVRVQLSGTDYLSLAEVQIQ